MVPEEAAEGSKPINGNELPIWTGQLLCAQFMFFFMMLTQQILLVRSSMSSSSSLAAPTRLWALWSP